MIKVLIVDDEKWVRKGILEKADWEELGACVVAEACNGAEGLEMIREYEPEIVLTDMKMPVMDGVKFIKKVYEEFPQVSVIIVSGYSDYEYTRQALLNRAFDYILKPIEKDELNRVLSNTIKKCSEEHDYKQSAKKSMENKMLNDLISGFCEHKKEFERYIEKLGSAAPGRPLVYAAADINIIDYKNAAGRMYDNDIGRMIDEVEGVISSCGKKDELIVFPRDKYNGEFIAVLFGQNDASRDKSNMIVCQRISKELSARLSLDTVIGIGGSRADLSALNESYKEAAEAVYSINIITPEKVLHIKDAVEKKGGNTYDDELHLLVGFMFTGDERGTEIQIDRLIAKIKESGRITLSQLGRMRGRLTALADEKAKELWDIDEGGLFGGILGEERDRLAFTSLEENKKWLASVGDKVIKKHRDSLETNILKTVNKIVAYMRVNYEKKITLEEMSKQFFVSKTYLCKKFKKETGRSFLDMLTELRMQKARELYEEHNMKMAQIAGLVGYADVRYFSKLYKKYFSQGEPN